MKVDITNSSYGELISMIQKFPNGKVTAKNGSAYWEWNGEMTTPNVPHNPAQQLSGQPQPQQEDNKFLKMFDSLASRI